VSLVPYWLNLDLGVLLRLWELADSHFGFLGDAKSSEAQRLLPPIEPLPAKENTHSNVWRMITLVVEPLLLTVHMRSPDRSGFTYTNYWAQTIMRLPADMPNMDVIVSRVQLLDQFGTHQQLFANLKRKYRKIVKYSAVRSIILSYVAIVIKGILNAIWWLARGPFDAIYVAFDAMPWELTRWWHPAAWLWWVEPFIRGLSEGTYRALAELVGNTVFGLVLILNALRHIILGTTRKRAHGILDGLVYGVQGLVLDTVATPFTQMYHQTMVASQDWGNSMALFVFVLCILRIPYGPILGVFHFLACCCEGLANALLHEEAQFAPFEAQRRTEGMVADPLHDDSSVSWGEGQLSDSTRSTNTLALPHSTDNKWWIPSFNRAKQRVKTAKRVVTDEDEAMAAMGLFLNL